MGNYPDCVAPTCADKDKACSSTCSATNCFANPCESAYACQSGQTCTFNTCGGCFAVCCDYNESMLCTLEAILTSLLFNAYCIDEFAKVISGHVTPVQRVQYNDIYIIIGIIFLVLLLFCCFKRKRKTAQYQIIPDIE